MAKGGLTLDIKFPELNLVLLSGRLTRDPELRYTPSGRAVTNMRIASSRRYKTSSGDWNEETLFIDVVTWGDLAERCKDRLQKGSPVIVQGRLRSREWTNNMGQKRTTFEIVAYRVQFLEKAGALVEEVPEEPPVEDVSIPSYEEPISDEDLPF
ncbi:MAG: single-stranded DNA-binding protein [Candidatus Hydrothermota bacterium]|nr:MAG: single-stranded DNA-binding protein [Candidatus Hydrothermae bacterium]